MKLHSLPLFVRLAGRPVILLGDGEAADAKRRLLERAGARIVGEEDTASLAIVALEDGAEAAVEKLRARGILVNAVDRPDLCDFTLPAIVNRDPVLVAISTGGASAGLAAALRQRLETLLPVSLGRVATALHAARAILRRTHPDAAQRRRRIGALLAPGGPLDPLVEHDDPATVLQDHDASSASDSLPFREEEEQHVMLAITSDDPDELTLRAARLLGQADRVVHAPDIPPALLDRARADALRVPAPAPAALGLTVELVWAR